VDTLNDKRIYLNLAGLVESGFTGMDLWVLSPDDPQPEGTIVLHQDDEVRVAVRHHTEETDG
jgi:hypothetical protein